MKGEIGCHWRSLWAASVWGVNRHSPRCEPPSTGESKPSPVAPGAYGYRNYEHLKERLLTLHHTKYTLQG